MSMYSHLQSINLYNQTLIDTYLEHTFIEEVNQILFTIWSPCKHQCFRGSSTQLLLLYVFSLKTIPPVLLQPSCKHATDWAS